MKQKIFTLFVALLATVAIQAQQIAVVAEDGTTTLFRTLDEAITGATAGSVIYLSGGGFPIANETIITKKLTIIGIGHRVKGDNADGYTTITGYLRFSEGSDGSAVMGAYITGNVQIGYNNKRVDDITVKYCNLNSVEVNNKSCLGTVINQNYIRSRSLFNGARADFTNNVAYSLRGLDNGFIAYNIFLVRGSDESSGLVDCMNCSITNNVFHHRYGCTDSLFDGNICYTGPLGENVIKNIGSWDSLFAKYPKDASTVYPTSDYHFKDNYEQYNGQIGIYGGTGFDDKALPPVPYIVSKDIAEKTDAEGKLKINIRVKASE